MSTSPCTQSISMGRIIGAFGVRGWVEVVSFTEPENNLFSFTPWCLLDEQVESQAARSVQVVSYRPHKQKQQQHTWVVQLAESTDRDHALTLRGLYIKVLRSQLPKLIGEYYWADLEGLAVYNSQQTLLGQVAYLFATGANDVLVVKNAHKTHYIPYVSPQVIKNIDLPAQCILVDWED